MNKGLDVYIVDDEPLDRFALQEKLRGAGFVQITEFKTVSDLEATLADAQQHPELILLDTHMYGHDTYEVCERIKGQPETAETLVIGMAQSKSYQERWQQAGADAFLDKSRMRHNGYVGRLVQNVLNSRQYPKVVGED